MAVKQEVQIEVFFTPSQVEEMQLKDRNVIVIDVLRASTSIATGLYNGAREIIPVGTIEHAVKISANLIGDVTLRAGERNGRMIEGFNLGNSPLEYTEEAVKGKSIIFITTNGSRAIVRGRHAKRLVAGSFVNLTAIVDFFARREESITIVCAGKANNFCLEDVVCAGKMIALLKDEMKSACVIDDAGTAALSLDKAFGKNILKLLKSCEHGRYLTEIGFGSDLAWCAGIDRVPIVPVLQGNSLRLPAEASKKAAST